MRGSILLCLEAVIHHRLLKRDDTLRELNKNAGTLSKDRSKVTQKPHIILNVNIYLNIHTDKYLLVHHQMWFNHVKPVCIHLFAGCDL